MDGPRHSVWRRLVALGRLTIIVIATAIAATTLALGRFLLLPLPRARRRWRIRHFQHWSRLMCRTLGGHTRVVGDVPQGRYFLATNHLGYLDIIVLAQYLPAVFVSKADVLGWPVVGRLTRLADTLYIERERHRDIPRANAAIGAALQRGDNVVLFPEGTSSADDRVQRIRPPLLQPATEHDVPVRAAALHFATAAGDPSAAQAICYYGDMVFARHVWDLLHIRGFTVTIAFSEREHRAADRKQLAESLFSDIRALQAALDLPPLASAAQPDSLSKQKVHHEL